MTQPSIKRTAAPCKEGDTIIVKHRTTTETNPFAPRGPFDRETTIEASAGPRGGTVDAAQLAEAARTLTDGREPDKLAVFLMKAGTEGTREALVIDPRPGSKFTDYIHEGEDGKLYVFLESRFDQG